jgi:hypothetical protein
MRSRYEDAKPALERVGSYPCFVRARRVPATGQHGRLNGFTPGAGDAFDVEDRERHTEYRSGNGAESAKVCNVNKRENSDGEAEHGPFWALLRPRKLQDRISIT